MLTDPATKLDLLKQVLIFNEFSEEELDRVAERLEPQFVSAGQNVFKEGDEGDAVYFVLSGEVEVHRKNKEGEKTVVAIFDSGDSFGEDALYHNRQRSATITAISDTELFYLNKKNFEWLRNSFPQVEPYINTFTRTHQIVKNLHIDWLGKDEMISLAARRHPIRMVVEILTTSFFVLVVLTLAAGLFTFLRDVRILMILSASIGVFMSLLGIIISFWSYLEWRNDYFFVTTHRVVWRERIIFRSASRQEVPLRAIQSLDVQTPNFIARMINVGNLVVRTFNTQMLLTDVDHPNRMKNMIDAFLSKARQKSIRAERAAIRRTIRQGLGQSGDSLGEEISVPQAGMPPVLQNRRRRFAPFTTRLVEEDAITYRKHWSIFIANAWQSSLALILSLVFTALLTLPVYTTRQLTGLIGLYFVPFGFFLWWLYDYEDWRNDIYKVTSDRIIDRDKKPFGKESIRSAPLRNIQSVGHQIPNTIGLILNVGDVKINVGEEMLTFNGVHDPALVHADIARKMEELAAETERNRLKKEHERMATWLRIFHEEALPGDAEDELIDDKPMFY